jgi:hypothetical protein
VQNGPGRSQFTIRDAEAKRAEIGRLCRARHNRPYAEYRIMPSNFGFVCAGADAEGGWGGSDLIFSA